MDAPRLRVLGNGEDSQRIDNARVVGSAPPESVTDEEVLDTLVVNNGIVVRVAAMLNMTEAAVMNVVSRNLSALSTKLRGRVMLSSFVTVIKLDAVLQAQADELPLDTLGRTYAASLTAFSNLAGQFEEKQTDTDTDDAEAAKIGMIERLERMGKREEVARAVEDEQREDAG
jgi:hypothetical protein